MAHKRAEMRQRRLRAVQRAHLDCLIGLCVAHELRAREVPRRPIAGELILDDPLAERLADDGGFVKHADLAGDPLDVGRRRRGDDAIDHG